MTRKRVQRQQSHIRTQDQGRHAYAKRSSASRSWPKARMQHVNRQNDEEYQSQVQKISVQVLEQEQPRFAKIVVAPRFADGAGGRIEKEGPVISLAVVITRDAEAARCPKNEKRRREPGRQPRDDDQRRKEWGEEIRMFGQLSGAEAKVVVG